MEIKEGTNKFYIGETEAEIKGEITFREQEKNVLIVDHTYVDPSLRNQGVARKLVDAVIDKARNENKLIDPVCPYVVTVMERDESTHDVLKK